jgi:TolB-like protein
VIWTLVVAAALAAKPAAPVKLAAPGLSGFNVSPAELEFFSEHFAQQLTLSGLQVTTAKQISTLLGMERQKEIMGCKDAASSCMAELAAALGVDGVLTGSVGKFETSYRVNVSIVAASDGHTLSAYSARAGTSEEVLETLTTAARQMAAEATRAIRGEAAEAPSPDLRAPGVRSVHPKPEASPAPGWGLRRYAWMPAAGAAVLAVAGSVFAAQAHSRYADVASWQMTGADPRLFDDVAKVADEGKAWQGAAGITYGVAGLSLAVAAVFFFTGDPPPAPVAGSFRVAPSAGGVALTWSWP